jgi:hypothetical protein
MNMPAAIARIARIMPKPAIIGTKNASPVRISQIPNNRKPIFFVNLMKVSFLWEYENQRRLD